MIAKVTIRMSGTRTVVMTMPIKAMELVRCSEQNPNLGLNGLVSQIVQSKTDPQFLDMTVNNPGSAVLGDSHEWSHYTVEVHEVTDEDPGD